MQTSGVSFRTRNGDLQRLYDAAEARLAENIVQFTPTLRILVEGGGYPNARLLRAVPFDVPYRPR